MRKKYCSYIQAVISVDFIKRESNCPSLKICDGNLHSVSKCEHPHEVKLMN
jgi:hypothetical protein